MTTHGSSDPPLIVPASRYAIGLDVGGTKTAAAVVTESGHIVDCLTVPTRNTTTDQTMTDLLSVIGELRRRTPQIQAIGIGAAGIIEWPAGVIRWAPNNSYRNFHLQELLEEKTGLPTIVDNDANTAAWAEARFGSTGPYDNMVFLTVGTGLGGGLILNGQLYRGQTGVAAEFGHMIVDPRGELCGCGNRGCLESVASGTALARLGREAVQDYPDSRLAWLASHNSHAVTGLMVYDAARDGDTVSQALFERVGFWLGVGIASLINIFELDAVVVGGGLADTGELLMGPARNSAKQFIFAEQHRVIPQIRLGTFGNKAGMVGAAHLALTKTAPLDPTR